MLRCCRSALKAAQNAGTFDKQVYELLFDLSGITLLDTQEIEGMNSQIKFMVKVAQNISLELLSQRLMCKKYLAADHNSIAKRCTLEGICVGLHSENLAAFKSKGRDGPILQDHMSAFCVSVIKLRG